MAGFIHEFFGYPAENTSCVGKLAVAQRSCPFLKSACVKRFHDGKPAGVCAVRQKSQSSPPVICCPNRLYANNYKILYDIAEDAFDRKLNLYAGRSAVEKAKAEKGAVAVFGQGWGGELRLPKRKGTGSYFVDWVIARLGASGELCEFTAVEVQTIDTTGSYKSAYEALLENRGIVSDTVGLNWENVSKRIIPQLIYKGQVLQREDLCRKGLYFVCPSPVYNRVLLRLGGIDNLPDFPPQPASIHFLAYDYVLDKGCIEMPLPLAILERHSTTVYKIQEAFSSLELPSGNVYRDAIMKSLYE
jgi:hypothetical protein